MMLKKMPFVINGKAGDSLSATLAHSNPVSTGESMKTRIRDYWNERIHDLAIVQHPVGTRGFFNDLEEYRFNKLDYLPRVVDFRGFRDKNVLELGCGVGIDLARFAKYGAVVTGVDLSEKAISLAQKNFELQGLEGNFRVMDGESLEFPDNSFDLVYAHGVLQYTADAPRMVAEMKRVLKPGGVAIAMVYNRISWLNFLSKIMKVGLEHADAPVLKKYSIKETRDLFADFPDVHLVPERFPVPSRLHGGIKGVLYNTLFVELFNMIPRWMIRRFGWHIMAFAEK